MSSSAPGGSAPGGSDNPDGKRKGLGKYVTRVKTILRSDKKRQSVSGTSAISVPSPLASPTAATAPEPSAKPTPSAPPVDTTPPPAQPPKTTVPPKATAVPSGVTRDPLNQEKAKALFQKYGLNLEPDEWPLSSRKPGERVEKPIRMRIHRTCHRCQNTFGCEKTCVKCGHNRCKKCPRYPPKKLLPKGKDKEKGAAALGPDGKPKQKQKYQLTMPSRTGGQDRVRKVIRQRVHRKCHKCDVEFHRGEKLCVGCGHIRCKRCPRDPPKLKKYPDGYPGDAEPEPEQRAADPVAVAVTSAAPSAPESRLMTARNRPKRIKPPPDPEVVKSVVEKLESMKLGTQTLPPEGSGA
ncbi:hypothetical protein GP486_008043 [Trichoglossum hirsutum]|uniref:Uncharacterized protein n=1 Tax=Trichoglossum hirsutum TaxID=265104 RepID=A0A9P8IGN0_9PEZI|nr:hypothetical protein GP486_008043 [Trichoglossum hirsutum]